MKLFHIRSSGLSMLIGDKEFYLKYLLHLRLHKFLLQFCYNHCSKSARGMFYSLYTPFNYQVIAKIVDNHFNNRLITINRLIVSALILTALHLIFLNM